MIGLSTTLCLICMDTIYFQECPTGGWWIHEHHPDDNHDAYSSFHPEGGWDDDGNYVYSFGN